MIYKFSCIGLLLVGLASNFHLTSEETIAKSAEAEKESVTYLLGHMIVADPFSKLKLSDQEKKDLVRGFADGLSNPKENEELKKVQPEVNVFMREKMTELREEENKKRQDEMSKLAFPMDTEILGSDGKKHTLASLAKGKKAVLLDFWATWCGPCVRLMPELVKKEEMLKEHGILVAGMNTEQDLEKAENFRKKKKIEMTWLVEPDGRPFSKLLKIDSIPRMIMVSPEGKILYNGHPKSEELHVALEKFGVPHQH